MGELRETIKAYMDDLPTGDCMPMVWDTIIGEKADQILTAVLKHMAGVERPECPHPEQLPFREYLVRVHYQVSTVRAHEYGFVDGFRRGFLEAIDTYRAKIEESLKGEME